MSASTLTDTAQRDREALVTWMDEHNITSSQLARATGFTYVYIYMLRAGDRVPTESFKWRFANAYGHDVAQRLFGDPVPA